MYAVLDFEGFELKPGCFVVKELVIRGVGDNFQGHWLFLPPSSWESLSDKQRLIFSWVTRNMHNLSWYSGEISYSHFQTILFSIAQNYTEIFVKGLEKKKFLQKLISNTIHNLEDWQCPKLKNLPQTNVLCFIHPLHFNHCALVKAVAFEKYISCSLRDHGLHSSSICLPKNTSNI